MPFTLGGDYFPEEKKREEGARKAVKISLEKRKKSWVTLIKNLPLSENELMELASKIKNRLATGGSVKDGVIEIQGSKAEEVKKILTEMKIKFQ